MSTIGRALGTAASAVATGTRKATRAVGSTVIPGVSSFSESQRQGVNDILAGRNASAGFTIPTGAEKIQTLDGTIADLGTRFTTAGTPAFKPTSDFRNYALSQAFQHHLSPVIQGLIGQGIPTQEQQQKMKELHAAIQNKLEAARAEAAAEEQNGGSSRSRKSRKSIMYLKRSKTGKQRKGRKEYKGRKY